MAIIKVELTEAFVQQHGVPDVGSQFVTDQGEIGEVTQSNPGTSEERNILVEVPDPISALGLVSASADTVDDGRAMHSDYIPYWLNPKVITTYDLNEPLALVRDTFEMSGFTEEVLGSVNWDGIGVFCIDTGVAPGHEAFEGYQVVQWSRGNPNSCPDEHGHGTFCLSQIGGRFGVARCKQIGMFQGLEGREGRGSEQSVSDAIKACAQHIAASGLRVAIVSMSLGGSVSSVIRGATEYLLRLPNVVVVVAAGNDGPQQKRGSPADTAGVIVCGAADRDFRPAPFTGGGAHATWVHAGQFGVKIVGANKDGGFMESSGTSMATPYVGGAAAVHAAKGRSVAEIKRLLGPERQHQLYGGGRWGVTQLDRADFIEAEPEPDAWQVLVDELSEAKFLMDDVRFRGRDPNGYVDEEDWSRLGAASIYTDRSLERILALRPKAPAPPTPAPKPPPTTTDSFGGSYPGHDPAFDLYPGGENGPHYGVPIYCPSDGVVERYSFASPLMHNSGIWTVQLECEGQSFNYITGRNADYAPLLLTEDEQTLIRILGTQMHIVVFRPDQPLRLENGQIAKVIWDGHVQAGFQTGRRKKGDVMALTGRSGVEFQNSDAAHGHICGSTDGSLTPNGNVDGYYIARALGFNPRRTPVPGPNEYLSGGWDRGKRRS